jgi:hypothetical protein
MTTYSLVYPMFAMVLLTAGVLVTLFRSRTRAVREKQVSSAFYRTFQGGSEPESSAKPARHFVNLFEAPTLFYAACLAAMVTQLAGPVIQALAWAYVAARIVHAYVHLGRNRLRHRIPVYGTSWLILLVMWVYIVTNVAQHT